MKGKTLATLRAGWNPERFWSLVDWSEGCWGWRGSIGDDGYGRYSSRNAHKVAYELAVGPVPAGLQVDHLCQNPGCVNPAHMEVVTGRTNTYRGISPWGINARKTHCLRGHPLDEANTYRGAGKRDCRKCRYLSAKACAERKAAARAAA